jgi:rubrerythrin
MLIFVFVFIIVGRKMGSTATKYYDDELNRARRDKQRLLSSTGSSVPLNLSQFTCFECGQPITKEDKFCPNCGDSTKEEFATS